jgi:hypothetical protein
MQQLAPTLALAEIAFRQQRIQNEAHRAGARRRYRVRRRRNRADSI